MNFLGFKDHRLSSVSISLKAKSGLDPFSDDPFSDALRLAVKPSSANGLMGEMQATPFQDPFLEIFF
jgi:hypothetical protein